MDCSQSFKQSKVQLEVTTHKETDRSNSNLSCTADLTQDSAVSSIVKSDPPDVQSKPDVVESQLGAVQTVENSSQNSLSRIRSSSRGGSTEIRLSGVLENHDPNRIPSSIFSGRTSNPTEWSTASNESLFSIHVGNNSFSKENFNFYTKSGELMMNPNFNSPQNQNLPTLPPFVEPPPRVLETKTEPQIPAISSQSVAPDHNRKEDMTTPMDELKGRQSVSNDSMNSSHSFQFPLLGSEGLTPKTIRSGSIDSGTTQQQQPMTKLQSTKLHSIKQQSPEHQSPSHETTSATPTANSGPGWFSCLSCCRCR